jgi:hypothetical protein
MVVSYQLSVSGEVNLGIYDVNGRQMQSSASASSSSFMPAGIYRVQVDASHWPAGVYILRLQAGEQVRAVKGLVIK